MRAGVVALLVFALAKPLIGTGGNERPTDRFVVLDVGGAMADTLPELDHVYPPLRKRPGATVLVEAAKLRNPYGPLIIMAEHKVGKGRVLFVGADTLWKWHTLASDKDGPTPYAVFWQQAFRALTPERSRLGGVNLRLTPSRTRLEVGQTVALSAETQSDQPLPLAKLEGSAALADGKRYPLSFVPDPADPTLFRAELALPQPGPWQIAATLTNEGKAIAQSSVVVQVESPRGEDKTAPVNRPFLERLAGSTGGSVIDPEQRETWPQPATESLPPQSRTSAISLWDNFTLLLLLCTLLAADWFIRLFKGLS